MPTPASGQIAFSDIALIIYNSTTTQTALSDSDAIYLAGFSAGQQIALSNFYNKPTAGNTGSTYNSPGSYSWIVVPYKTLTAQVSGAGGAGGGICGGQVFFGCVNYCASGSGNAGNQSNFNGVIAYGGGGGSACGGAVGSNGGNNLNGNTGGGGAKGLGYTDTSFGGGDYVNCSVGLGANGGVGGFASKSWTKGVDGPGYSSTINFTVGAGGTGVAGGCRPAAGYNGGSGSVYISWS